MRPRLTQLSLAVIMESTNIILVYCPPLRGLIQRILQLSVDAFLLPPIAGIDTTVCRAKLLCFPIAPIAGIDMPKKLPSSSFNPIAPIAGIDTPCRERSAAQQRRPFHTPPSTLHTPSLRSPPHLPFRRGGFCDSKTITKNIFDLTVAPSRKNDIMCMNEKINAFCIRFGSVGMFLKSEGRKP